MIIEWCEHIKYFNSAWRLSGEFIKGHNDAQWALGLIVKFCPICGKERPKE